VVNHKIKKARKGLYFNMDFDILRRIAERGRSLALKERHSHFVDLFQHFLDELERYKKYEAKSTKNEVL
jgi:hypothetical protein